MSKLTTADRQTLDACACYEEWAAACKTVKARHGGTYPSDWFDLVIKSGMADRILGRWGMDTSFQLVVADTNDVPRVVAEVPARGQRHVRCKECGRTPEELPEYIEMVADEPDDYKTPTAAAKTDGTYNEGTGKFWCTTCYIRLGEPLGKA